MTSNTGKRLDKLKREIVELGAKGKAFHFIVGDANEDAEAKLERLKSEGRVAMGDEIQIVQVPWVINQLKGSTYIPEGNPHDPLADPGIPPPAAIGEDWGEKRDREKRWQDHVKKIERDGERFDPDKKRPAGGWR